MTDNIQSLWYILFEVATLLQNSFTRMIRVELQNFLFYTSERL